MRAALCLVLAAIVGGCAANVGFQVGSTGRSATAPSVGPGGSFSSSGINARFGDVPSVGALLGMAGLGWLFGRGYDERQPPALDASRRINEQDCAKPVEGTGNLRCN